MAERVGRDSGEVKEQEYEGAEALVEVSGGARLQRRGGTRSTKKESWCRHEKEGIPCHTHPG